MRTAQLGKLWSEVNDMTGRNNHPDNDGPAASPSRLDQFGEKQVQNDKQELKQKYSSKTCK